MYVPSVKNSKSSKKRHEKSQPNRPAARSSLEPLLKFSLMKLSLLYPAYYLGMSFWLGGFGKR